MSAESQGICTGGGLVAAARRALQAPDVWCLKLTRQLPRVHRPVRAPCRCRAEALKRRKDGRLRRPLPAAPTGCLLLSRELAGAGMTQAIPRYTRGLIAPSRSPSPRGFGLQRFGSKTQGSFPVLVYTALSGTVRRLSKVRARRQAASTWTVLAELPGANLAPSASSAQAAAGSALSADNKGACAPQV